MVSENTDIEIDGLEHRWYMEDFDPNHLQELVNYKMPFGKYKGTPLCDLPEPYLVWFHSKGFPEGKLGALLATIYEIKLNGLAYLLKPLKEKKA